MSCIATKIHNKDSFEKEFGKNFHIQVSVNFRLYPEKSRKKNAVQQRAGKPSLNSKLHKTEGVGAENNMLTVLFSLQNTESNTLVRWLNQNNSRVQTISKRTEVRIWEKLPYSKVFAHRKMETLKSLPLHSPFQHLKTRKTICVFRKKCKGVTNHLHGPAPQQPGILKKQSVFCRFCCRQHSSAAEQGHSKRCEYRAHVCSCNAKRSYPGAKSTPLNVNFEGYKLSPSCISTTSSWWFLPKHHSPRLRQCCSETAQIMNKVQLFSLQLHVSSNILYTPPTPGVLKNMHCYCYRTNDSFLPFSPGCQPHRCESELAIDILFLVSHYTNKKYFKRPHSVK